MFNLDLCITLRCNAHCPNCIELCNSTSYTGLDYSDSDMTLGQIDYFVSQVIQQNAQFNHVYITGGEPLLHPKLKEIFDKVYSLYQKNHILHLHINSNLILKAPEELREYIVNFSLPKDNPNLHHVHLLHPTELTDRVQTYDSCNHYRKSTLVLNYLGYSICCAGDAYVRLFGREDLILHSLPSSVKDFPSLDPICEHCPFGWDQLLPLEKQVGHPVSAIYHREAEKNKTRKLVRRFPEL